MIKDFTAVIGDDNEIFNADAEAVRQVYTGFDGKDHAGHGLVFVGGTDIALLVVGLADEVAEAVIEFFFVAIFGQEISGGCIDGR